jgi:hypothetical protein
MISWSVAAVHPNVTVVETSVAPLAGVAAVGGGRATIVLNTRLGLPCPAALRDDLPK